MANKLCCVGLDSVEVLDQMAKVDGVSRSEFLRNLVHEEIARRAVQYEDGKCTVRLEMKTLETVEYLAKELRVDKEDVVEQAVRIALGLLVVKVAELQSREVLKD